MEIAGINLWSILAAGAGGFVFASVYYAVFGRQWQAAAGLTQERVMEIVGPGCFLIAAVCNLITSAVLAGVLFHFGADAVTVKSALITAFLLWLGFTATTLAVNHRFKGEPWALTVIDGGAALGIVLTEGLVLGLMGI